MVHNHTTGSISRQERRRQAKAQARLRKRRKRQAWKVMRSGQTSKRIRPTPRAGSYLVRRFWDYFGLTEALEELGVRKFKGLAASTLLLTALLFGVLGAQSVSDLTDKARWVWTSASQPTWCVGWSSKWPMEKHRTWSCCLAPIWGRL